MEGYRLHKQIKPKICNYVKLFCSLNSFKCWSCGYTSSSYEIMCTNCHKIQDVNGSLNHFDIFDIPNDFEIDINLLTKKFRKLQAVLHPDKFSRKSSREQELSLAHSSLVNKAYETLLQPVLRAEYLLAVRGAALTEHEVVMDQQFLMEIMEINEELEEAEGREAVARLGRRNKATRDALLQSFSHSLKNGDLTSARQTMAKIKYYENIHAKVVAYERTHGIVAD